MNKRETVQALMDSIQRGEFDHARTMLADDFQFSGPVPEPMHAEAWLGMCASLKAAFPDLDYHFKAIGAEGDVVRTTAQLSGTHTGPFDLTGMEMGVIPATDKAISTKLEKTKITVREGRIISWAVEPTEGAGLTAILKQLDVLVPVK